MTDPYLWMGITGRKSYDSPGATYVQNARFWVDGELQRRHGMTTTGTAQSGQNLMSYRHPLTGLFAVYYTNTGQLVATGV